MSTGIRIKHKQPKTVSININDATMYGFRIDNRINHMLDTQLLSKGYQRKIIQAF